MQTCEKCGHFALLADAALLGFPPDGRLRNGERATGLVKIFGCINPRCGHTWKERSGTGDQEITAPVEHSAS